LKFIATGAGWPPDLTGRQQHAGIIGRGIAIHGNGVEGIGDGLGQHLPQQRLVHGGVGGDEGQHRCHIGPDHPRALGDAGDGDFPPIASVCRRDAHLGRVSVVMMPWAASSQPSGLQCRQRRRQPGHQPEQRQRFADHSGGKGQHLQRGTTGQFGQSLATRFRVSSPCRPVPALALPVLITR
jgi:hypothetical protein